MVATGATLAHAPSRRSVLAGMAATAGAAWAVDRLGGFPSHVGATRVAFEIKTLPADEDPFAVLVGRQLADWFQEAGIDASVLPVTGDELLRQVLFANEYDAFVAQFPGTVTDPDALYALVHSSFAAEPGWQNPFGYSSLSTDEELERQRRIDGEQRRAVADSLQETVLEQNPFTVLAFPDRITALRDDRFEGLARADLRRSREYHSLERTDDEEGTLRVTTTDFRVTTNLNPLNPEYRNDGLITDFLYDPIAYHAGDGLVPWLASDVTWVAADAPTARVTLREDTTWHDGEALTADDVAFTYALLQDTSLGELDEAVPVTRYRGRSSVVEDVEAGDEVTVTLRFRDCNRPVARRALTLPILPEHVWRERAVETTGSGARGATEAIATNNLPAVGSGPLQFERAEERHSLVLARFDDHVTNRRTGTDIPSRFADGLPFEELVVRFVGSDASAVNLVASDEADATVANVGPDIVPRIGSHDDVDLDIAKSRSFYFAGYNARRPPFSNARFRALIGRLIDRGYLATEVFEGYATPAVSPLAGTRWAAPALESEGSTTSFVDEDGTLSIGRVRDAFTDAGYRYDEDGRLFRR